MGKITLKKHKFSEFDAIWYVYDDDSRIDYHITQGPSDTFKLFNNARFAWLNVEIFEGDSLESAKGELLMFLNR